MNSRESLPLLEAPECLREVEGSPAFNRLFQQIQQWIWEAQEQLEGVSDWGEFREARGCINALRKIQEWKHVLLEETKEAIEHARANGRRDSADY